VAFNESLGEKCCEIKGSGQKNISNSDKANMPILKINIIAAIYWLTS